MIRFANLSTSDLNRKIARVSYVETDEDDSTPLPTVCPPPASLIPTGPEYSDDWMRADADTLGPNWVEFFDNVNPVQNKAYLAIRSNSLRDLASPAAPPPDTSPLTKSAYFSPMPDTTKDQYTQVILLDRNLVATGGPAAQTFGGEFQVLCRCNANTTGNGWFEAGAGGVGTQSGIVCYNGVYHENYLADGTFSSAQVSIYRNDIRGIQAIAGAGPIARMNLGDVLKLTAANFVTGGQEVVCLKIFINDVLKAQGTDFDGAIPGIRLGRQLTGRGGISSGGIAPDPLNHAFAPVFFLGTWTSQACLPNPI